MNWFSLFFTENSLFDQTNSLFRGVGNSKLKPYDINGLGRLRSRLFEAESTKFPVFSLLNREIGPETGSLQTAPTATHLSR